MSLLEIRDDLLETISDLYINAGEIHLEELVRKLEKCTVQSSDFPSKKLVQLMETLCSYDDKLLDRAVQNILYQAVDEIVKDAGK